MYRELAHQYDATYASKDYEAESARLVDVIDAVNPGAATLLDVACGTGGHLVHLRQRFQCEGVDLDPEMVELARRKLPGVRLHVGDMTGFDLQKRFDAVACLFSSVGHLGTVEALDAAVGRMAAHLRPGGVLLVEPWIAPEDWLGGDAAAVARVVESPLSERGRVVMAHLLNIRANTRLNSRFDVSRLRGGSGDMSWFSHDEYRSAFERVGLETQFDEAGLTGRGLYIARPGPSDRSLKSAQTGRV